jgi:hypothetical protein
VKLIDFGSIESLALPFTPSLTYLAGFDIYRIFEDAFARAGAYLLDNLLVSADKLQPKQQALYPMSLPLSSSQAQLELEGKLKGAQHLCVMHSRKYNQFLCLVGEEHDANLMHEFKVAITPAIYFTRIIEYFKPCFFDVMLEKHPLEATLEKQRAVMATIHPITSTGGSFTLTEAYDTFYPYDALHSKFFPTWAARDQTLLPWKVRVSYVDNRTMPHIFVEMPDHPEIGEMLCPTTSVVLTEELQETWEHVGENFLCHASKLYDTPIALEKLFADGWTGDPYLSIDTALKTTHFNFNPKAPSQLSEMHTTIKKHFQTLPKKLVALADDLKRFRVYYNRERPPLDSELKFHGKGGYDNVFADLNYMVTAIMDIYVYCRFFHHFKGKGPSTAENVLYLAGADHTQAARDFLRDKMGYTVHYEQMVERDESIALPKLSLLEKLISASIGKGALAP